MRSNWRVIDRGGVPEHGSNMVDYTCLNCGVESRLPVLGAAIAQVGQGLVFDTGSFAMPAVIQCRHCRRKYEIVEK